ncbi:hypothetical protein BSKO_06559 [Bryopsis sp. KO-2023]|nr:hypothetical protein BSKO_06559 [Bryopsis sp. KO-2023]
MKVQTLQVLWHDKQPVLSLDFHSSGWLATSGADKTVKLWKVSDLAKGTNAVEFIGDLAGHTGSVNCIRFSPNGKLLASGGDSGELLLWKPNEDTNASTKENVKPWVRYALLRGHSEDIYDLCWSLDSSALLSGAVDNKAAVWDVAGGKRGAVCKVLLANHMHYVQGVAWDPANEFLVTQGADRTCRVYHKVPVAKSNASSRDQQSTSHVNNQWALEGTLSKRTIKGPDGSESKEFLFHDDTLTSFYRRLAWSPDGSFVVIPAGLHRPDPTAPPSNCAFAFARGKWSSPVLELSGLTEAFVCVRFCPVLFRLRNDRDKENGEQGLRSETGIRLPYRIVFAIATLTSVILYASEDPLPLAVFGGLHCSEVTDLAWSENADFLAISSRDGYCTFISFEPGELGLPLERESLTPSAAQWLQSLNDCKLSSTLQQDEVKSGVGHSNAPIVIEPLEEVAATISGGDVFSIGKGESSPSKKRITPDSLVDKSIDLMELDGVRKDALEQKLGNKPSNDPEPLRKIKKRRIAPVVDTDSPKKGLLGEADPEIDRTENIEKSAAMLFGGAKPVEPRIGGLFSELTKLASKAAPGLGAHGDGEVKDDKNEGLGGMLGIIKNSRFGSTE